MMNLLLRVDASARIGTGHVMRCLALAQAWQEKGGRATFVMTTETPAVEARLASEGMQVTHLVTQPGSPEDAQQTVGLAQQREAVWIVVDGYYFGADYQQTIKRAGLRLLFVDDYGHAGHYYADLVLNQNIYANESLYPKREPHTRLL
ncbi:MAG: UDP-2,4-diacetamido-2,4,6-trideoxy-beta-L-altropyranose hydrolase, partial [Candidatus Atribacteria bacterium]|nr:UDP-2,4-diacetamido-2,4,6-trideoxy-beta-L-altropyranose hydrolase [Candidatus Atribacteria bacterium]